MSKYKTKLDIQDVTSAFVTQPHCYFVTIKPPRDIDKHTNVVDLCHKYLSKRKVVYWIVPSISANEYNHYHGIIMLPNDMSEEKRNKFKSAFQRKVNRYIGYNHPIEPLLNLARVYRYIVAQRNDDYSDIHNIETNI